MSIDYLLSILKPMLEGAQATVLLFLIAIIVIYPAWFYLNIACKKFY